MDVIRIDCDECDHQHSTVCDDCLVTFLCERDEQAGRRGDPLRGDQDGPDVAGRRARSCGPASPRRVGSRQHGWVTDAATDAHPVTRRARILELGRSVGLDAVGACTAEPFDGTRVVLEDRRAAGLDGGMQFTYRNPARSTDPSATLAGCRSLVVGAVAYPAEVPAAPDRPHARVARYATTDHYSRLRRALDQIAQVLRDDGEKAIVVADENGLVDRAAAHRAGLGWYGKSANLLLPGRGSYFLLGSVITTADLGADPEPVVRRMRILSALPRRVPDRGDRGTGRRRRGAVPVVVAPANRRVPARVPAGPRGEDLRVRRLPGGVPPDPSRRRPGRLATGAGTAWIDVAWLLTATDDELMERVDRWYIPDRDPRYVRRNALVVLGNVGDGHDPEVVSLLRTHLGGSDELLVGHAAWAAIALGRSDLLDDPRWSVHPAVEHERAAAAASGVGQDGAT